MSNIKIVFLLLSVLLVPIGQVDAADVTNPCEPTGNIVRKIEGGDSQSWYQGTRTKGYTDTEIRDGFIWWIEQPNTNPGMKEGWVADKAAFIGMDLFRNDAMLERAVLEAQKSPNRYEAGVNLGQAVGRFGSLKLIESFRKIGFDTPTFDEIIARRDKEISGAVPDYKKSQNRDHLRSWTADRVRHSDPGNLETGPLSLAPWTVWLLAGLASLMIGVGIINSRKISRVSVIVLILFGVIMLVFAAFVMLSRQKSVAALENVPEESHVSTEAVFSSNVIRPPSVEMADLHPAPSVEEAQEDDFLKSVEELMKPFSEIDPVERPKADAAKAAAARELMDLLRKGRPSYFPEGKWRNLIDSVVARQAQNEENMARCLEVVKLWIDDKNRNPGEAVAALAAMMNWSQQGVRPLGEKEFERAGKIAELQISLLSLVPKEGLGELLGSLTAARKAFQPGREPEIQTVVSAEKAAALIRESMGRFPEDAGLQRALISVVANRVRGDPSSLNALGPLLQEMLGNAEVGDLQKLGGYRAISSFPELPPWIKDNEIAAYLEAARTRQPEVTGTFFANSLAMEISEARVPRTEGEDRMRYANILLKIAGDQASAEAPIRLRSVRALVNSKVITADEAVARFGSDSIIGSDVKKSYLPK